MLVLETPNERVWEVLHSWVDEKGIVEVLQDIAAILEYNGLDAAAQAKALDRWVMTLAKQIPPFLKGIDLDSDQRICKHPDHNEPGGCGNPDCWKGKDNEEDDGTS